MARPLNPIVGKKFNMLTVLAKIGEFHRCRCDCGVEKAVRTDHIKTGHTKSCGCHNKSVIESKRKPPKPKVEKARVPKDVQQLRSRWYGMMYRCNNPKSTDWENYGGRGITVCDRWHSFELFYADMGARFKPQLELERKDNNAGYSPENCTWATKLRQNRNRRDNLMVEYDDGVMIRLADAAKRIGLTYNQAHRLYYKCMTIRKSPKPTHIDDMLRLAVFPEDPLPGLTASPVCR